MLSISLTDKYTLIDEDISKFFTDYYNLFLDYNFFKFYFIQNKSLTNDNRLMFTVDSTFMSKFTFLYTLGGFKTSGGNIKLKRSPGMTRRKLMSCYK